MLMYKRVTFQLNIFQTYMKEKIMTGFQNRRRRQDKDAPEVKRRTYKVSSFDWPDGQTHEKGWNLRGKHEHNLRGKHEHKVWCLTEENYQEDGNHSEKCCLSNNKAMW